MAWLRAEGRTGGAVRASDQPQGSTASLTAAARRREGSKEEALTRRPPGCDDPSIADGAPVRDKGAIVAPGPRMNSVSLRLDLFNRFVLAAGDAVRPVTAARRRALIAFLACQPDGQAPREQLATLMWGDSPDAQARQSLRQALLILRRELGPDQDLVLADRDRVGLDLDRIRVDRRVFDSLAASADPADLRAAAGFDADAFLADLALDIPAFEDWLRAERMRCLSRLRGVLERVAEGHLAEGREADALPVLERLAALSPEQPERAREVADMRARATGRAVPFPVAPAGVVSEAPPDPPGPAQGDGPAGRPSGADPERPAPSGRSRWLVPALAASNLVLLGLLVADRGSWLASLWPFSNPADASACASGSTRGATRSGAQGWMHARPGATCRFVGYLVPDKGLQPDELRVTRAPQLGQATIGPDRSIIYVAGDRPGTDAFAVEGSGAHEGETLPFRLTFTIAIRP